MNARQKKKKCKYAMIDKIDHINLRKSEIVVATVNKKLPVVTIKRLSNVLRHKFGNNFIICTDSVSFDALSEKQLKRLYDKIGGILDERKTEKEIKK